MAAVIIVDLEAVLGAMSGPATVEAEKVVVPVLRRDRTLDGSLSARRTPDHAATCAGVDAATRGTTGRAEEVRSLNRVPMTSSGWRRSI